MLRFPRMRLLLALLYLTNILNCLCFVTDYPLQYVSLCLAAGDDHLDIHEWVEYHYLMGVAKIYVVDSSSKQPLIHNLVTLCELPLLFWT